MGIAVLRGRNFDATDDNRSRKVALIDELLAKRYFAGRDPIGQRIIFTPAFLQDTAEIVGVVGTVKEFGLADETQPAIYFDYAQRLSPRVMQAGMAPYVAIRTRDDPESKVKLLTQTIGTIDPLVPVYHIQTMTERLYQTVGTTRFASFLASLFAIVAFVLGLVGVYSVLSYVVVQRQREIAIRLAIGARPSDVMGDVLRRAAITTGIGIVAGLILAWVLTRALAGLLLGVNPHDPAIFAGATAIFGVVSLAAASVPAFRTTRVDPRVALRVEG